MYIVLEVIVSAAVEIARRLHSMIDYVKAFTCAS